MGAVSDIAEDASPIRDRSRARQRGRMAEDEAVTERSSIAQDLRAIHKIILERPPARRPPRDPWWGNPCTEAALELLEDEYGAVPNDVAEFYRTTDIASFGPFDEILGPETLVQLRERLSRNFSPGAQEDLPEIYENDGPLGRAILPMSGQGDWGCLIELGGPQDGRVINPPHFGDHYWRTLAWSLSDAVACIRELYELGWYHWEAYPFGPNGSPRLDRQEELARLQPIFGRWNCNPVIAGFEDQYSRHPARPTDS